MPLASLQREQERHKVLEELGLLDSEHEQEFDELVSLASEICNTPISLVSLVDSDRQWFKASCGTDLKETPREYSFCSRAIEQQDDLYVVQDASVDPRFDDNPLVTDGPQIRFYAGIPLRLKDTVAFGTLCVIDTVPRNLSEGQQTALRILAKQVQARLELRRMGRRLEKANAELEQLANTDGLTGLLNRRVFDERMSAQFALALRSGRPLSLMLLDLDDFKKKNDQFGHPAGDEALVKTGHILQHTVRICDVAARVGGEEFAVLMPDADAVQAQSLAHRIQELMASLSLASGPLTASVGVASLDQFKWDANRLWACADDAMYEAKRTGKNRVVLHQTHVQALLREQSL